MIIAVDFDGTIVEHEFPRIGAPVPGALEWLKKFQQAGALLILLTMRSDGRPRERDADVLSQAVAYCSRNGVSFWAVNDNPEQAKWTGSRKVYAHVYIDDAGAGCPLVRGGNGRDYVDWSKVGPAVMEQIEARKKALSGQS